MLHPRRFLSCLAPLLLLAACQGDEQVLGTSATPLEHELDAVTLLGDPSAPVLARAQRFATAPASLDRREVSSRSLDRSEVSWRSLDRSEVSWRSLDRARIRAVPLLSVRAAAAEVRWGEGGVEVSRGGRGVARLGWAADEPATLADVRSGVALALVLEDVTPVTGRREGDALVFEGAWRGGGDVLRRPIDGGFEDFLLFGARQRTPVSPIACSWPTPPSGCDSSGARSRCSMDRARRGCTCHLRGSSTREAAITRRACPWRAAPQMGTGAPRGGVR
ncbi:MAG: hypothetical protein WKG00_04310 [Polyangiaceae bacterium]